MTIELLRKPRVNFPSFRLGSRTDVSGVQASETQAQTAKSAQIDQLTITEKVLIRGIPAYMNLASVPRYVSLAPENIAIESAIVTAVGVAISRLIERSNVRGKAQENTEATFDNYQENI